MKNHQIGAAAEKAFEEIWKAIGKRAFCHRLPDASDIYGLNRKNAQHPVGYVAPPQPADYVVGYKGEVHFAEVKGTTSNSGFSASRLERGQRIGALKSIACGCKYFVYVFRLPMRVWFRIPASHVLKVDGHMKWDALKEFSWNPPTR